MEIVDKNISRRQDFRLECQKCKCKKVSLSVSRTCNSWDSDNYYLVCNHCGNKRLILDVYAD